MDDVVEPSDYAQAAAKRREEIKKQYLMNTMGKSQKHKMSQFYQHSSISKDRGKSIGLNEMGWW